MSKKVYPLFLKAAGLALMAALVFRFGQRWLQLFLLYLSSASWARRLIGQLPLAWRVASRFVAGEDIEAAINATRELNARGLHVTLDYLGENVVRSGDAVDARNEILKLLDRIQETGVDASVSVKLSQLGLKIDQKLALDNARMIATRAADYNNKMRIDMEDSSMVDDTLSLYRTLRDGYGLRNVGVVIQAYLYRSAADVQRLVEEGASVRLCKGAYAEPPEVAYPVKADTDRNFVNLMQLMLSPAARQNGVKLAVATHDDQMIAATTAFAEREQIDRNQFEFQMLYGVRRERQEALAAEGYPVRVYVPFGTAWYPYFLRRLAERPANLWFFASNLLRR